MEEYHIVRTYTVDKNTGIYPVMKEELRESLLHWFI